MAGFNTIPSSSGGGSGSALSHVASVIMETYNRSWTIDGGVSGVYGIYSNNQNNGYAYFVGAAMTTGVPLNQVKSIPHDFTRIDIVAPQGDLISLYKAKVKSTTLFNNPLSNFNYNTSTLISSGNFELPTNATVPFTDLIVVGGGGAAGAGHGDSHGGGGGGGGGNVINLTEFPVYGSTIVSVGAGGSIGSTSHGGNNGGNTSFGNVYAYGGGGGGGWSRRSGLSGGNGGGGGGGSSGDVGGSGQTQTSTSGLGTIGSPLLRGGFSGGRGYDSNSSASRGGGGGGCLANGTNGGSNSGGDAGAGHVSSVTGLTYTYGPGGYGINPNGNHGNGWSGLTWGAGGQGTSNGHPGSNVLANPGQQGAVVVKFYIP